MLVLTRKSGESLLIGDDIELKIIETLGDKVKIGISAPDKVKVLRKELFQTIEENQQAAHTIGKDALKTLLNKRP
ncbi:MAG: carbon storage regulator CsrA [Anaerotruncus sp.]|nr:carbon storage regulator CsrA [Anaerotruncus sp.]